MTCPQGIGAWGYAPAAGPSAPQTEPSPEDHFYHLKMGMAPVFEFDSEDTRLPAPQFVRSYESESTANTNDVPTQQFFGMQPLGFNNFSNCIFNLDNPNIVFSDNQNYSPSLSQSSPLMTSNSFNCNSNQNLNYNNGLETNTSCFVKVPPPNFESTNRLPSWLSSQDESIQQKKALENTMISSVQNNVNKSYQNAVQNDIDALSSSFQQNNEKTSLPSTSPFNFGQNTNLPFISKTSSNLQQTSSFPTPNNQPPLFFNNVNQCYNNTQYNENIPANCNEPYSKTYNETPLSSYNDFSQLSQSPQKYFGKTSQAEYNQTHYNQLSKAQFTDLNQTPPTLYKQPPISLTSSNQSYKKKNGQALSRQIQRPPPQYNQLPTPQYNQTLHLQYNQQFPRLYNNQPPPPQYSIQPPPPQYSNQQPSSQYSNHPASPLYSNQPPSLQYEQPHLPQYNQSLPQYNQPLPPQFKQSLPPQYNQPIMKQLSQNFNELPLTQHFNHLPKIHQFHIPPQSDPYSIPLQSQFSESLQAKYNSSSQNQFGETSPTVTPGPLLNQTFLAGNNPPSKILFNNLDHVPRSGVHYNNKNIESNNKSSGGTFLVPSAVPKSRGRPKHPSPISDFLNRTSQRSYPKDSVSYFKRTERERTPFPDVSLRRPRQSPTPSPRLVKREDTPFPEISSILCRTRKLATYGSPTSRKNNRDASYSQETSSTQRSRGHQSAYSVSYNTKNNSEDSLHRDTSRKRKNDFSLIDYHRKARIPYLSPSNHQVVGPPSPYCKQNFPQSNSSTPFFKLSSIKKELPDVQPNHCRNLIKNEPGLLKTEKNLFSNSSCSRERERSPFSQRLFEEDKIGNLLRNPPKEKKTMKHEVLSTTAITGASPYQTRSKTRMALENNILLSEANASQTQPETILSGFSAGRQGAQEILWKLITCPVASCSEVRCRELTSELSHIQNCRIWHESVCYDCQRIINMSKHVVSCHEKDCKELICNDPHNQSLPNLSSQLGVERASKQNNTTTYSSETNILWDDVMEVIGKKGERS